MIKAAIVAARRPVLELLVEMINKGTSKLGPTNARIPFASPTQASIIHLSSSLI